MMRREVDLSSKVLVRFVVFKRLVQVEYRIFIKKKKGSKMSGTPVLDKVSTSSRSRWFLPLVGERWGRKDHLVLIGQERGTKNRFLFNQTLVDKEVKKIVIPVAWSSHPILVSKWLFDDVGMNNTVLHDCLRYHGCEMIGNRSFSYHHFVWFETLDKMPTDTALGAPVPIANIDDVRPAYRPRIEELLMAA